MKKKKKSVKNCYRKHSKAPLPDWEPPAITSLEATPDASAVSCTSGGGAPGGFCDTGNIAMT